MHAFSISEALEYGWEKTRDNSALLFQIMLTFFALEVLEQIVSKVLGGTLMGFLASVVLFALGVALSAGFTAVVLRLASGAHAHYKNLLLPCELVWRYFAASLLCALAVVARLVLLVVPLRFVAVRLWMVRFAVID